MHPRRVKLSSAADIYVAAETAPKVKDYCPPEDVYGSTLQNFAASSLTETGTHAHCRPTSRCLDAQPDADKPTKKKRKVKKLKNRLRDSARLNTEVNGSKLAFDMNWDDE